MIRADVDHGPGWEQDEIPRGNLPAVKPDDDALLIYTSGSTGEPKGALHTHRSFIASGWNSVIPHELSAADRTLCVLPLYHVNAESVTLLATLLTGGSVVMPHRFVVRCFWEWIAEYRCTWSAIVPTIISQLLEWGDPRALVNAETLERIRFMRSSSAPLAPSLHRAFEERFGILLLEAMGSTECGGNIFANPLPPGKDKIGTPGRPYGFKIRIMSPQGTEVSPGGSCGKSTFVGLSVLTGYYKNPEGTSGVIRCRRVSCTSGDLAYIDEDGYVFIVGRAKELIIKGGMNIAPRQIDDVLLSHPSVLEAMAALGRAYDHFLGEDIVAFRHPQVRRLPLTRSSSSGLCRKAIFGIFKSTIRLSISSPIFPRAPRAKSSGYGSMSGSRRSPRCLSPRSGEGWIREWPCRGRTER